MAKQATLYSKAVQITEDYLGPAGERFLRRQIEEHLNIRPENLQQKHVSKLINWLSIAFSLLTNKQEDIDAFTDDLKSLAKNGRK